MSEATPYTTSHHGDAHDDHSIAHPMPMSTLWAVFGALMVLTVITVLAAQLEPLFGISLGAWDIVVAMLIAVVKAALVALYFMHLRHDAPFNGVILIIALLFVSIFIVSVMTDAASYQVNMSPPQGSAASP